MYLLGESGGFRNQERLKELRSAGRMQLLDLTKEETDSMAVLVRLSEARARRGNAAEFSRWAAPSG